MTRTEPRTLSVDDTIRDLFRSHSKKDLIEVIVEQVKAVAGQHRDGNECIGIDCGHPEHGEAEDTP